MSATVSAGALRVASVDAIRRQNPQTKVDDRKLGRLLQRVAGVERAD